MKAQRTLKEKAAARERSQKANALFTDAEVRGIRKALREGSNDFWEIAQAHGCGVQTVKKLWRGETYGWVRDTEEGVLQQAGGYQRDALQEVSGGFDTEGSLRKLAALQEREKGKGRSELNGLTDGGRRLAAELTGRTPEDIAAEVEREADAADRWYIAGLPKAEE